MTASTRSGNARGLVSYVYWGAIVGLISSLGTLFVVSVYYSRTLLELAPAACMVVGCALTGMLSQPVGILGLAVGGACGALCGLVAHFVRHRLRPS